MTLTSINRKSPLAVVILAAGQGTRMKDPTKPKVLHTLRGTAMIDYVIRRALQLAPGKIVAIVGYEREQVVAHIRDRFPDANIVCAIQDPQLGTGHAMMQAERAMVGFTGDVLVLYGDVPMLSDRTLRGLLASHAASHAAATVLTAVLDDPAEYGRIIRSADGSVGRIIENKDATPEEKKVKEINSGIYVFDAESLFHALELLTPTNAQGEYYLTDVFAIFRTQGLTVSAQQVEQPFEVMGINSLDQLREAESQFIE